MIKGLTINESGVGLTLMGLSGVGLCGVGLCGVGLSRGTIWS